MSKLHKIVAGLALSTATIGGALALGAGAASAEIEFEKSHEPTVTNGLANGLDDSTGGIAQGNRGLGGGHGFPVFLSPNGNDDNQLLNHNQNLNQNNDQNWWANQSFWNQGAWSDQQDDFSGFGLVAKDVAIGFQDKTNKDNSWFNNNWFGNNNWWYNNDDNWWHRNNRDHVNG
ncbi:hypothetical protein GCM10010116_55580 [Microbispora rosea subsp. aerata]|nr:hypothetical protein [Microbispora rosea]GGO27729.1 hypothetical protein GCM10010116_55580 [Microbispora rosea subsp. aerata]GIH56941.1 hypothetical protein Mro02_38550 [Microbispora rosea subsp. aerata]GLJ82867.1 hypothetical protein GCM10017588_15930 [Microbispora rosea subsp. aerata]